MYKNFAFFAIGVALLLSLFCVDAGYAFQTISRKPPVDFMTVAHINGWTEGPLQVIGVLLGSGVIVLIGFLVRRMRLLRHGYQS